MTDLVADGAIEQLAGHVEQDVRLTTARQPKNNDANAAAKKIAQKFHGIKLSELAKGIKITPNFLLAMAFLAFTAWLFVVYWIRRHEPLANQVLGQPRPVAPTARQDLVMMGNSRNALPIKTAPGYNGFFAPNLGIYNNNSQQSQQMNGAQNFTQESLNAQSGSLAPTGSWNPAAQGAHSLVIRGGREQIQVTNPEPIITSHPTLTPFHAPAQNLVAPHSLIGQSLNPVHPMHPSHPMHTLQPQMGQPQMGQPQMGQPQMMQPVAPSQQGYNMASPPQGGVYQMHVPQVGGSRLKTVVNR